MTATEPILHSASVRVTRIRAVNRKGCIASGHLVDIESGLNDRASAVVLHVPADIASPSTVVAGGIFEVYGEASTTRREHCGFVVTETLLRVQDIRMIRPSGSQIIQWLVDNVLGIGEVKATKLWDNLGERLYEVLDLADHDAIREIIPSDKTRQGLFACWTENGDAKTLHFVQDRGIPLDLARKAIKFHQRRTVDALLDDPYRLLSFSGSWRQVDSIARERFGVGLDDPRRLAAALEESLHRVLDEGHTCAKLNDLHEAVCKLLKPHAAPSSAMAQALIQGREKGQFVARETATGDLMLHAPGTYLMERQCAEFIQGLLRNPAPQQQLYPTDIDALIRDFEREEQVLGIPTFTLNDAQRVAVKTSFVNRFSIITGGAGVGKTTVLKALYRALDTLGRPRFQMALSGRATARIIEATRQPATTIAGFLRNVSHEEMGPAPVVIIDEASMLDVVTFYRLVTKLPSDTHLILVGDPYQLPPIGAGLVLHVLCGIPGIPSTQLTEVKRQAKESDIPGAAKAIREGQWPAFASDSGGEVVFIPCTDDQIIPTVLRLYEQDRGCTQILGATRSCPYAGVERLNRVCHERYASSGRQLTALNPETGEVEATGFCEGDLLLYTANNWQRNLQNGCLGRLVEVFDEPVRVNLGDEGHPDPHTALGRAIYEGVDHYVLESDVDVMQHAYAITVHKSQGSQFRRVIVPVRKSRLLDRTFIYTAVTRAQVQVILVGDEAAVRRAVELPPQAFGRRVGLIDMLAACDG